MLSDSGCSRAREMFAVISAERRNTCGLGPLSAHSFLLSCSPWVHGIEVILQSGLDTVHWTTSKSPSNSQSGFRNILESLALYSLEKKHQTLMLHKQLFQRNKRAEKSENFRLV